MAFNSYRKAYNYNLVKATPLTQLMGYEVGLTIYQEIVGEVLRLVRGNVFVQSDEIGKKVKREMVRFEQYLITQLTINAEYEFMTTYEIRY